jgi:hypothetical protein
MRDDNEAVRTSVVISNGARAPDNAQPSAATKLRQLLAPAFTHPGAVVSCNVPADDIFNYRKLCGYTNVQGRHINGDADACRDSVDRATGRFIHIEQDWSVLRAYAYNWGRIEQFPLPQAIRDALAALLPPVSR